MLQRFCILGENVIYCLEANYSKNLHSYNATARFVDGYSVLFYSLKNKEKLFGVKPDHIKAEIRLREKMGEVLEARLQDTSFPFLR